MSTQIHPTAVIEDGAELGEGVVIGPYSVLGPRVVLGDRVVLKSHVVVEGITQIGEETEIYPFASIGHAPQDKKFAGEESELIIGARNQIREHVTMNPGTEDDKMKTVVGNDGLFMMGSHVAHDCIVGNNVIMANNATLAGHVEVGDNVIIGGLAAIRQFVRIGNNAMIGGMAGVVDDVIPYGLVLTETGALAGLNLVGLQRAGFSRDEIKGMRDVFDRMFAEDGTLADRLKDLAEEYANDDTIKMIVDFAQQPSKAPKYVSLCKPKTGTHG